MELGSQLPAYIVSPPSGEIPDPPVQTRRQTLPFRELSWPDFERLCLRLVDEADQVEEAKIFGEPGEAQGGIDLLARQRNDTLAVFQCRRVKRMGPAQIKQAVTDFLEGPWAGKADSFAICTPINLGSQARAEEVERQRKRVRAKGKTLDTFDLQRLSLKMKSAPGLVDDFFGREWVKIFNGDAAASALSQKLDRQEATATRADLAAFYREVFQVHDAGLSLAPTWADAPGDLRDLFVVPDLIEDVLATSASATKKNTATPGLPQEDHEARGVEREIERRAVLPSRIHSPAESWLSAQRYAVVTGTPGAGKSSLLRFLSLDLLSTAPRFPMLLHAWKSPIPLWIPFGRWTEIIEEGGERSIDNLLQTWLRDLGQPELFALYRKALADRRAVLLVDGLDEWKTVGAARVALDQLRIFSSARGIRAIATARPSAFQQLGPPPGGWAVASLAGLTNEQQLEAVERLSEWATTKGGSSRAGLSITPSKFVSELSHAADLRELASVPLTLVFLYWIRARDARLPRDRFAAYDALVDLLLSKYPARRTSAAAMVAGDPPLDEGDFRLALASLAFVIQVEGSGDIEADLAVEALREHLVDDELGPGIDNSQALALGRELLKDAQNRLGILFDSGARRLAFLHRSVQEHLCAAHISRFALDSQLLLIGERGGESQWVEAFLNLIYITTRPDDVDRLIEALRSTRHRAGFDTGDPLMAEIGVGKFGSSTRLSRQLIEETASHCETFSRPAIASSIAVKLIDGLQSQGRNDALTQRFRTWLPARPWSLVGLYAGMQDWPSDPKADRALERALFSGDARDSLAAAEAYSARLTREKRHPDFLEDALSRPLEPMTRSAVLWALVKGWPTSSITIDNLADARISSNPELRLIAIMAAVERNEATLGDLDQALALAGWNSSLGYDLREQVIETLIHGWPRNERLKKACLADLESGRAEHKLDSGVALSVALWAFPFDPDVERYCVAEIQNEDHPFVGLSGGPGAWKGLAANFHDMPALVEAADAWLTEQRFSEPETAYAALIGKTDVGKSRLLRDVADGSFPFWAARSLIDGWGLADPDVRNALKATALGQNDQAGWIATYLPIVLPSRTQCGERLLELLSDDSVRRHDLVLQGIIELDDVGVADRAVDMVLGRNLNHSTLVDVLTPLIELAPHDPRVRALAELSLSEPEPPLWSLSRRYGDDAPLRGLLSDRASPLPAAVRTRCWEYLSEMAQPVQEVIGLAQAFPLEQDGSLATQMAYSYVVTNSATGHERIIDLALRSLRRGGPGHEGRFQAALGALLTLGALDVFRDLTWGQDEKPLNVPLSDYLNPNIKLASIVVDHWSDLVKVLGPEYASRFSGIGGSAAETFWDVVATVADRSDVSRQAVNEYLRTERPKLTINLLTYMARTQPRSDRLREACLDLLKDREVSRGGLDLRLAASSILAEQFSDDAELGNQLVTSFESERNLAPLVAIAEGWNGPQFQKALAFARKAEVQGPSPYIWRVRIAAGNAKEAIETLESLLEAPKDSRLFIDMPIPTILNRVAADREVSDHLSARLSANTTTTSEYASYSRLLAMSVGLSKDLRASLRQVLKSPMSQEIGLDIVASGERAVGHSVADALETIQ